MRFVAALLLVALSGCAAQSVPPAKVSTIKTVGVVSSIGDQVTLKDLGLIIDTYQIGATAAWGIDDFVVKAATDRLAKRYEVRPVAYDVRAFHSAPGAFQSAVPLIPALKAALVTAAGNAGSADAATPAPDAYVVITKQRAPGTVTPILGVGLLHDIFGMTFAFAIYDVSVVDGHDFTLIGQASGQLPDWTAFDVPRGPHERVDGALWADKFDALTPTQQQQIVAEIDHLVSLSLPVALYRMNFLD